MSTLPVRVVVSGPPGSGTTSPAHRACRGEHALSHRAFDQLSLDAPWIEVDIADGDRPGISEIAAFVNDAIR